MDGCLQCIHSYWEIHEKICASNSTSQILGRKILSNTTRELASVEYIFWFVPKTRVHTNLFIETDFFPIDPFGPPNEIDPIYDWNWFFLLLLLLSNPWFCLSASKDENHKLKEGVQEGKDPFQVQIPTNENMTYSIKTAKKTFRTSILNKDLQYYLKNKFKEGYSAEIKETHITESKKKQSLVSTNRVQPIYE